MALGYLISPALQLESTNGKPLTGGWLTVNNHGTTDFATTYSNFDGTLNPRNIELDHKGMATVIADDGLAYDVYCYDRNGVQQWSRLNVKVSGSGAVYKVQSRNNSVYVGEWVDQDTGYHIFDLDASRLDKFYIIHEYDFFEHREDVDAAIAQRKVVLMWGDWSGEAFMYRLSYVEKQDGGKRVYWFTGITPRSNGEHVYDPIWQISTVEAVWDPAVGYVEQYGTAFRIRTEGLKFFDSNSEKWADQVWVNLDKSLMIAYNNQRMHEDPLGFLAPYIVDPDSPKVLMMQQGGDKPVWGDIADLGTPEINMVQDTPAGSIVTKIDTLNIHQDSHEVYGDVGGSSVYLGFVAPHVNSPVSSDKMLMITDGSETPAWRDAPEYYVARIEGSSPNFTCNYAQLDYAYSQGKICFIANAGSGALSGWLKYKDSLGFLFECFHAQIMHGVEIRVASDNSVKTINRNMYASRLLNTYQCTRAGREDFQNPAATMTWVGPSYLTTSSTAQWYFGTDYSIPTGYANVLASLRNTSSYERIRFSSSGSICHYRDSDLAGTPNSFYRITVVAYAKRVSDRQYVTFNLSDSPVVHVNCDNYTQSGSTWGSDWVNYSIDYTTDTNVLYNAGLSRQYEDWRLVVQYELVNESQSTSYHWLGMRNETQRITQIAHL